MRIGFKVGAVAADPCPLAALLRLIGDPICSWRLQSDRLTDFEDAPPSISNIDQRCDEELISKPLALCDFEEVIDDDVHEVPSIFDEEVPHDVVERPLGPSNNKTSVRGLQVRVRNGTTWYQAALNVDSLNIMSREVNELSKGIDYLIILTSIKQHAKDNPCASLFERVRHGIDVALKDCRCNDIGLRYKVQISKSFWVKGLLVTPTMHNLADAMRAADRLAPFRSPKRNQYTILHGPVHATADHALSGSKQWEDLKKCFVDICCEAGQDREGVNEKIRARETCSRERDAHVERYNLQCMRAEEHQQRREMRAQFHQLHAERRNFTAEDKMSRLWRRRLRSQASCETRVERMLQRLLRRRRRSMDQSKHQVEREQAAARKRELQLHAQQRKLRWRAMKRPDLTMADILERRWDNECSSK
eukprot:TRINITY_DN48138_c0_g1_i1.p1 TRINITY_DN48138_c0_g1~~TRINITY_DN48138_c0_g1_i1.p1  ORF type:complete len:428 (-),score=46.01 TRINITY_DN48138_c0_g1_i1:54-1310(-)